MQRLDLCFLSYFSIHSAACRSVVGWHHNLGRHNMHAFLVCVATAKLVILFMQYKGWKNVVLLWHKNSLHSNEFLCSFVCVLHCLTYVAGSEDVIWYQSLSVVGA